VDSLVTSLRDILLHADLLISQRREFFWDWLRDHFKITNINNEQIVARLLTQDIETVAQEVKTISEEYEWCRTTSLREIERMKKKHASY